jgi:hypothetical protein
MSFYCGKAANAGKANHTTWQRMNDQFLNKWNLDSLTAQKQWSPISYGP